MTRPRFVNGRTASCGPGGFARYHDEVTRRLVADAGATVVAPPPQIHHPVRARWWEQRDLVRATAHGVLLSTANNGPLRHPRHVVVVHDLLALTHPHTVSPTFARFQRAQLPRLCRSAAEVVTVSEHVADQLAGIIGLDRAGITVAPPGVGTPFRDEAADGDLRRRAVRARLGIDDDRVLVTALISSIPRKRSAEVLAVLRDVVEARPEVEVVVAGHDGPARVFGRGATRPAAPTVRDLGAISDDELRGLLSAADVFVALPEAEGFGLPQVEAWCCGAAVVSTPVPSLTELRPSRSAGGVATATSVRIVHDDASAVEAVVDLVDRGHRGGVPGRAPDELPTWDETAASVARILHRVGGA